MDSLTNAKELCRKLVQDLLIFQEGQTLANEIGKLGLDSYEPLDKTKRIYSYIGMSLNKSNSIVKIQF